MNTSQWNFRIQQLLKRAIDITVAVVGLLLLLPFLLIIAAVIKLDSPGGALYSHRRIGKDGRSFLLYKFRSMTFGGDDSGYMDYLEQLIESERDGNAQPYRKMDSDPRVTRVGNYLRRFFLDELPQLWNVLWGEMSLVGPRPHVQLEVDHYTPEQRRRLSVKPGLTGLWQVVGKADCTFNELLQLDLDYIDQWSLRFDMQLIFFTIVLMLKGGEGVWTRKPKEAGEALPVLNVFRYEGSEVRERELTVVE
jgi:lipopolysaccharide/colanic/teichoic acid biosynthesis glycosyltransferase